MTVRILQGDCRQVLSTLAEESVHCCITSPPYWGLRDYGIPPTLWGGDLACEHSWGEVETVAGGKQPSEKVRWQHEPEARPNGHIKSVSAFCHCGAWRGAHGLEPTIDLYVKNAVEIFRAVHRVLRPDGTLWLNLGDSYASHDPGGYRQGEFLNPGGRPPVKGQARNRAGNYRPDGLKPKDLCGIPWRVAFALQADGWWLRQDIIWAKPNPMPESVTDRCTKAHEYLFLLTKSARYFFDAEAIREPISESTLERWSGIPDRKRPNGMPTHAFIGGEQTCGFNPAGRNKRSVWTVATSPFPEAHFATFPPELIEPCIKAGTSEKGCCAKCGAPWERQTKSTTRFEGGSGAAGRSADDVNAAGKWAGKQYGKNIKLGPVVSTETLGWRPTCKCGSWVADKEWNSEPTVPCTVLDPFGGAGTTGLVADRLQRNAILIELNPTYAAMAHRRLSADAPLLAQVEAAE